MASVLDGKADCGWSLPRAERGETTKRCVSGHHCNSLLEQRLGDVWGGSAPIHLQGAGGLSRKTVLFPLQSCVCTGFCRLIRIFLAAGQFKAKLMSSERLWDVVGIWAAERV